MAHKQNDMNELQESARKIFSGMSDTNQSYLMLALGLFLLLFAVGYFAVLKSIIGLLGCFLIVWGALRLNLIKTVKDLILSVKKRF